MSWCSRLLPYLEQNALWERSLRAFAEEPFFEALPHWPVLGQVLPMFDCPAGGRIQTPGNQGAFRVAFTSYLGVEGTDQTTHEGLLLLNSQVRFSDIRDGASKTLMVDERPSSSDMVFGWWYAGWGQDKGGSVDMNLGAAERMGYQNLRECPNDSNMFQTGRLSNQCDALHFWSVHFGGAHFLFADGPVHFLSYAAKPVMVALATRAGGEAVAVPD